MTEAAKRRSYPSDLSDVQWRRVDPLIPPERTRGRHRSTHVREIVNAINYRRATGCAWRMLPHDFPPWGTVYTYFRAWERDGTLAEIWQALAFTEGGSTEPRRGDRQPAGGGALESSGAYRGAGQQTLAAG